MFDALTRRSPRRRWSTVVLIGSFSLHAAAALTVMVWSMWKIEKLVPERMPVSLVWGGTPTVELPPQENKKPPPQKVRPEPKHSVTNVQPTKTPPAEVVPEVSGGGETDDEETVEVSPIPSVPCDGPCTGEVPQTVLAPVCGDRKVATGERCDDGNTVDGDGCSSRCQIEAPRRLEVPPNTIEILRISGEAQIQPPPSVPGQMQRNGQSRADALFRVCLDTAGQVAEVSLRKSTGFADYDARLAAGVRSWRYRPYAPGGRAVAVCGSVRFVYVQH